MSNKFSDKIGSLFSKLKSGKKAQYVVVIVLCVAIVLILCFGFNDGGENSNKETDLVSSYVSNLEDRLSKTLSLVEGAGNVEVVITVQSGMQTIIATKVTTTENAGEKVTEETPILVNGKTVVLQELYPKITGVLIVAKGANKISVLNKIQQATVSLLDIELNQIEILTMK